MAEKISHVVVLHPNTLNHYCVLATGCDGLKVGDVPTIIRRDSGFVVISGIAVSEIEHNPLSRYSHIVRLAELSRDDPRNRHLFRELRKDSDGMTGQQSLTEYLFRPMCMLQSSM